jgi:hypothetical protein
MLARAGAKNESVNSSAMGKTAVSSVGLVTMLDS